MIEDNAVLNNCDKARHGDARGLDGKAVQTEQCQDHAADRLGAEADRPQPGGDAVDR